MAGLKKLNFAVGLLHLVQGVVIVLLSSGDAGLPVTTSFLEGPPGAGEKGTTELFELPVDFAVATFLWLAAADHLLTAGPLRGWYERRIGEGRNPARWAEYSVSASLMVVLIALLSGINEAAALIGLFGASAAMILFGDLMERMSTAGESVTWRPFIYGCLAGVVPWIAIGLQLVVAGSEGEIPTFVIAIFISLFALYNLFGLNQWLQYRGFGPWRSYVFGERVYLLLSLVAKSALAWQVYQGALAG